MHLSFLLLPFLALQALVNAQSSPITCLLPSNSSFILSVGQAVAPQTGCPSWGADDPLYLVWPDSTDLFVLFLGNDSGNGTWEGDVRLPDELPVYGFGWIMYRFGSVQSGPAMFEFASELSPMFAILPPSVNSSSGLRPGDIRLLQPSDIPIPFNESETGPWPMTDRIVLQVDPSANSIGKTVTLLLYGVVSPDPYPEIVLGEDVPLPAPGTQLEYFVNMTTSDYGGWVQVVVVPSLAELDNVLAVSVAFQYNGTADTAASALSGSATPSSTVTLDGTSFSAGITLTDYSVAPSSSFLSTLTPQDALPTAATSSTGSSPPASTSVTASLASSSGSASSAAIRLIPSAWLTMVGLSAVAGSVLL